MDRNLSNASNGNSTCWRRFVAVTTGFVFVVTMSMTFTVFTSRSNVRGRHSAPAAATIVARNGPHHGSTPHDDKYGLERRSDLNIAAYQRFVAALVEADSSAQHEHAALKWIAAGDYGDFQVPTADAGSDNLHKEAKRMGAEFVLGLGDNFYYLGVPNSSSTMFRERFSDYWARDMRIPWFLVNGNHDYLGNPMAQVQYMNTPGADERWNMPGVMYTRVFTAAGGMTAQFVFIDTLRLLNQHVSLRSRPTNMPRYHNPSSEECFQWLERVLRCSTADYLFVVGHYPIRSDGRSGDTPGLDGRLLQLLLKYGVNAYMCGHDHSAQHLAETGTHLHYFVLGSAGRLSALQNKPSRYRRFALSDLAVGTFMASPCALVVRYVAAQNPEPGHVVYRRIIPNWRRDYLTAVRGVQPTAQCPANPSSDPNVEGPTVADRGHSHVHRNGWWSQGSSTSFSYDDCPAVSDAPEPFPPVVPAQ